MTYTIIGSGNMAWFLARRLTAAGHQCAGIYGRDKEAAKELAVAVRSVVIERLHDIHDNVADICILAVTDAGISEMANSISFKNTVLVHTAGAVSIEAITNAAADCGVLWPIYSISKNYLPDHREIPCAWEANTDKARRYLLSIAHGITDVLFEAKDEQRKWLHLSAVISNNFNNHLMAICEEICGKQNIPFTALQPIIAQTFARIQRESPLGSQTGPAIRGDETTMQKHIDLLQQHPDWQKIYADISASIKNMYHTDSNQ